MQTFSFATAHYWGFGHVTKCGRAGMVAPEPDQNRPEKPPHWLSGAHRLPVWRPSSLWEQGPDCWHTFPSFAVLRRRWRCAAFLSDILLAAVSPHNTQTWIIFGGQPERFRVLSRCLQIVIHMQICVSREDLTEERCQGLGWLQLCTISLCFTPDCFFI